MFARTGASVGKSYLYDPSDGDLVFAGFLINVEPNPRLLNAGYLAAYLQSRSYWDWVERTSMRSGQPGINGQEYARLPIPVPEMRVQEAIASSVRDADAEVAMVERLITKYEGVKRGLMQQLLTGKTRLPGFEGPWSQRPLGEIAHVTMGQSPPSASYNEGHVGLPLVQGNADIRDRRTCDRLWTSAPTKICAQGDVVLTVRAPVGFTGVASNASCVGRGVCALRSQGSNRYLFHALVHSEANWSMHEQGSIFTAVNGAQVRQFTIALPDSHKEQVAIAAVLDNADATLVLLHNQLGKAKAVRQGLIQELLAGDSRSSAQELAA